MSVYVSQRFESESIRNLPIRARTFLLLPTEEEGLREDKKKNASLSDFDAKTMRAKESTRTGRVQSTTNDWTFLDPFFAAGAIFMFDFFLSVWWDFARENVLLFDGAAEREKWVFFFRFSFFQSFFCSLSRHFFFFDKEEDKEEEEEDKKEDDFQLGRIDGVLPVRVLVPGTF